jgi:hypothetical protein
MTPRTPSAKGFPRNSKKAWSANSGLFYCLLRTYLLEYPVAGSLAVAAGHRHRTGIRKADAPAAGQQFSDAHQGWT